MREILFRGKRTDNGKWVEGSLDCGGVPSKFVFIRTPNGTHTNVNMVDPATVGQWTGLKDKDGVLIFEGDVISAFLDDMAPANETRGVVAFEDYGWVIRFRDGVYDIIDGSDDGLWTVIGNIHDNPDLLEVE